ncbi:GNAT family N-acetyltransferase [Tsukamurella soli]|uniref:Lysine N-acyltransferase MbtK n=1 Tax=Tsukamurella soli TaxID=644556 RepID=A0ABP8JUV4_9ACTN
MNRPAHPPIVLPREVPDTSSDMKVVPAPNLPELRSGFSVRLVDLDSSDIDRVAEWMSRPHLLETWEQGWSVERWRDDAAARLAGDYSRPLIFGIDGVEVGYAEIYRVARDEVGKVYDVHPYDLGLHIATGEPDYVGRGRASAFIGALTDGLLAADPAAQRVVADPDVRNARMHGALRRNGFVNRGDVDVRPGRRIALFVAERATRP